MISGSRHKEARKTFRQKLLREASQKVLSKFGKEYQVSEITGKDLHELNHHPWKFEWTQNVVEAGNDVDTWSLALRSTDGELLGASVGRPTYKNQKDGIFNVDRYSNLDWVETRDRAYCADKNRERLYPVIDCIYECYAQLLGFKQMRIAAPVQAAMNAYLRAGYVPAFEGTRIPYMYKYLDIYGALGRTDEKSIKTVTTKVFTKL